MYLQVRLRACACAAFHHDSLQLRGKLGADLNDYFRDLVVLRTRKRGMNKTAEVRKQEKNSKAKAPKGFPSFSACWRVIFGRKFTLTPFSSRCYESLLPMKLTGTSA